MQILLDGYSATVYAIKVALRSLYQLTLALSILTRAFFGPTLVDTRVLLRDDSLRLQLFARSKVFACKACLCSRPIEQVVGGLFAV